MSGCPGKSGFRNGLSKCGVTQPGIICTHNTNKVTNHWYAPRKTGFRLRCWVEGETGHRHIELLRDAFVQALGHGGDEDRLAGVVEQVHVLLRDRVVYGVLILARACTQKCALVFTQTVQLYVYYDSG